jgi:hypothetical protein
MNINCWVEYHIGYLPPFSHRRFITRMHYLQLQLLIEFYDEYKLLGRKNQLHLRILCTFLVIVFLPAFLMVLVLMSNKCCMFMLIS